MLYFFYDDDQSVLSTVQTVALQTVGREHPRCASIVHTAIENKDCRYHTQIASKTKQKLKRFAYSATAFRPDNGGEISPHM